MHITQSTLTLFFYLLPFCLSAQIDSLRLTDSTSLSQLSTYSLNIVDISSTQNSALRGISRHTLDMGKARFMSGTLQDPSRMLLRFPGVMSTDDSRNNLVVRGNSPVGVGWYIEGLPSLNPNHFVNAGNSGGGINILNPYILQNINFYTGAFPAQYGNALSAVVDVKLRYGNAKQRKFHIRTTLIDIEAGIEGPVDRSKRSSYIAVYRRFNVDLAKRVYRQLQGFVGNAPDAQDASFKLHFPNDQGYTSFYGILGTSNLNLSESFESKNQIIARSASILGGGTFSRLLSETTVFNVHGAYAVMHTGNGQRQEIRQNNTYQSRIFESRIKNTEYKLSTHISLTHTPSDRSSFSIGLLGSFLSARKKDEFIQDARFSPIKGSDISYNLFQCYAQWNITPSERLEISTGLHALYLSLNHTFQIDPRFAISWKPSAKSSISLAYGKQSQFPPSALYVREVRKTNGSFHYPHLHLKAQRSNQYVISYQTSPLPRFLIKLEAYYLQHFYIIDYPYSNSLNFFSGLNLGYDFGDDVQRIGSVLANTGRGRSYGLEFFAEKYIGKSMYILATASIYEAKYTGNWDIERSTAFNGNYIYNVLFSKTWPLKRKASLITNIAIRGAGGRRYSPVDSITRQEIPQLLFSQKYKDYFRTDLKISLEQSFEKFSHQIGIDLRNLFNTQNILYADYNFRRQEFDEFYQLGFLPLLIYEIKVN